VVEDVVEVVLVVESVLAVESVLVFAGSRRFGR